MVGEQPTIDVPSGYRIGGWEVRELLDSGGFASVYAARNVSSPSGESAEPPAEDPYADRSTDYIEGERALQDMDSDLSGERTAVPALT